jgi:hypothetical protein
VCQLFGQVCAAVPLVNNHFQKILNDGNSYSFLRPLGFHDNVQNELVFQKVKVMQSVFRVVRAALLSGGLIALISACAPTKPTASLPPSPEPPAQSGLDRYLVCQADLSEVGWDFTPVASFVTPEGCGIEQAVRLERSSLTLTRPVVVTCDLAYTIARFEFEIIQPAAEQIFGQEVTRIEHVGSYNCRGIIGKNSGQRLSEHAKGKAIDVVGFVLKDGTRIRVLQDWRGQGKKSDFLQRITKESCRLFSVVLGPNANKEHQDHLHLDVGPQRYCGA